MTFYIEKQIFKIEIIYSINSKINENLGCNPTVFFFSKEDNMV